MDWIDYREVLGIGLDDEEKEQHFIVNMFNFLSVLQPKISTKEYMVFCASTGTSAFVEDYETDYYDHILKVLSDHSKDLREFLSYYIALLNAYRAENELGDGVDLLGLLTNQLANAHISYEIIEDGEKHFILPKGVKQFDDSLVSEVLYWLKDYPETRAAWTEALKQYSNEENSNASQVADSFRKALERLFQEVFRQSKSLEHFKSEYGTLLNDNAIPKEISNDLQKLLNLYTDFNNHYAKHNDKVGSNVLEYIMYQTGNIMRLLITLNTNGD